MNLKNTMKKSVLYWGKEKGNTAYPQELPWAHHLVLLIIHISPSYLATYMCCCWLCLWHTLTAQNDHVKERRKDLKEQFGGNRKSFKQWCNPSDLRFVDMKHAYLLLLFLYYTALTKASASSSLVETERTYFCWNSGQLRSKQFSLATKTGRNPQAI